MKRAFLTQGLSLASLLFCQLSIATPPINIDGVSPAAKQNVRHALILGLNKKPILSQWQSKDLNAINEALKPYGYFHASVQLTMDHNRLNCHIKPGRQIQFHQFEIQIFGDAANDPAFLALKQSAKQLINQPLDTTKYEHMKKQLSKLAAERGYLDANLNLAQLIIRPNQFQASAHLIFFSGKRHVFGPTHFNTTPYSTRFLQRFLHYETGQPYSLSAINLTQQSFSQSGLFQHAAVTPQHKPQQQQAITPVDITLTPKQRFAQTIGLGYGTDTDLRLTINSHIRRLNAWGHALDLGLQLSRKKNGSLHTLYTIPGFDPARDSFIFGPSYTYFKQAIGEGRSFKFTNQLQIARHHHQWVLSLNYVRERYHITHYSSSKARLFTPAVSWHYQSIDNLLYVNRGWSTDITVSGARKGWLSSTSFSQFRLKAKTLMNPWGESRFLIRSELARTFTNRLTQLPISMQLFAGGARSIRGYGFSRIGPGRHLFTVNLELQQHLINHWYLTGFYDFGNVTNDSLLTRHHWHQGAGLGVAWESPVGLLELSAANALTTPNHPWVIQFSMGPLL